MSLLVKKGSFAFPDSSSPFNITGVGFQPKAVIFWLTKQSAVGYAVNRHLCVGFATGSGTQQGSLANFSSDAETVSTAMGVMFNEYCIKAITASAGSVTTILDAALTSMNSDGFTLDPNSVSVGAQYIVHYLALGGSDLTDAQAKFYNTPVTSGSTPYTGIGFQPDAMLFLSNTFSTTIPHTDNGYKMCLGAASSPSDQATVFVEEQSTLPTNLRSVQVAGNVLRTLNFAGTDNTTAALESFDSDGFTLNYSLAQATARAFLVLALKGGSYKVIRETQKTSTGTKQTTGIGFQPTGLLLWGKNQVTSTSVDASLASLSIGASDGTTEGSSWVGSTDNVSTTDENSKTATDKIFGHSTNPSTTNAEADLSSFDSDGFTLDWTTADATAREFIAFAMGNHVLVLDSVLPDADITTTGWGTAPLFSKVNDASDATVITATAS